MENFWQDYQRRRWMRPNAHLYVRPDAARWLRPNQQLWQGPNYDERKYNPNQPRVPAGGPDGGQWTDGSGDGGQRIRVAGGGRSIGGGRGRFGAGDFPGSTYGQQLRLDLGDARAESALQQVRQYDPDWKPKTDNALSFPSGIEGEIARSEARAAEAEARLEQLRTGIGGNFGPPLKDESTPPPAIDGQALVNSYRAAYNMPDLFGNSTWPLDRGTVAVTNFDGKIYFGINSTAPGYGDADFRAAQMTVDSLVEKYPNVLKTENVGEAPNDSVFHAESTILLRLARANGGDLAGRTIEVYTDRAICSASCEKVLPLLGLELGNPTVIFVQPDGARRLMYNGRWQ